MTFMKRHDTRGTTRELWQSATTIARLGDLTAQWLDGALPHHPGYGGMDRPDQETASIAATLAAINRVGSMVTIGSQPGHQDQTGEQRAQVDLFATTDAAAVLAETIHHTNAGGGVTLIHTQQLPVRARLSRNAATRVPISRTTDGQITAYCGYQLTRREIAETFGSVLRSNLVDQLAEMQQVTIHSEHWGLNLEPWQTIAAAVRAMR